MYRTSLFAAACLLGCTVPLLQAGDLLPIPDAAAQAKVEKLIKELFRREYLKGKLADRLALARKLWEQAGETKDDPVARFVLLREARDISARAGDVPGAFKVIEEMARGYAANTAEMRTGVLEAARRSPYVRLGATDTIKLALAVLREATDEDDFASAARLLKLAEAAAPAAKSVALLTRVQSRAREVEEMRQEYARLQPDRDTLQKKPDDPQASFRVGRYLALNKGKWGKALPLLAQGSDATWKAMAKQDLEEPQVAQQQLALADGWWDLGESMGAKLQPQLQLRAAHWYKQALPELAGLSRTKAEKRLKDVEPLLQVAKEAPDLPGAGTWLVVFRSHDPKIWNQKANRGANDRAVPLGAVPDNIRFLKLTDMRSKDYVVVPMTKDRLGRESESAEGQFGWQGTNHFEWGAHQMGVYNRKWASVMKGQVGLCVTPQHAYRGWGFGVRGLINDKQGYTWAGVQIAPTVFEVAVSAGPLTAAETKKLLPPLGARPGREKDY